LVQGRPSATIEQWEERAQQFGARSVFNLGHGEQALEQVTAQQKAELYPHLQGALLGQERTALDLGCGPGRFTPDLARLIGGRAIGVDPIQRLLDLAPKTPEVEYRRMVEGRLPLEAASVDVVWICLVLGGLEGRVLHSTVAEVHRVLRPGGLLFLVENTTEARSQGFWHFRSAQEYQRLFLPVALQPVHTYDDLGERISVLHGRLPARGS
jgi:SAM-dependent methyltransferase